MQGMSHNLSPGALWAVWGYNGHLQSLPAYYTSYFRILVLIICVFLLLLVSLLQVMWFKMG